MAEPLISLVVASVGRVEPLAPLFASLARQEVPCEVILVDQNDDDRLAPVVAEYAPRLDLRHIRAERRGVSFARNAGLALCRGAIVGFPDDDCVYPDGVLTRVAARFAADPALALLSGPAQSPEGGFGSGRWAGTAGPIGRHNVFITVIAFNLFLRRDVVAAVGGFDPALGVGASFGSCEETDLVLRVLPRGAGLYDTELRIIHPDKRLSEVARARAHLYGTGFGYVLRKHRFGATTIATFLIRPLGGLALAALRRDALAAGYYWATFRGRLAGYLAGRSRPTT